MIFELLPLIVLVVCGVLLIFWFLPRFGESWDLLFESIEENTANKVVEKLKKERDQK